MMFIGCALIPILLLAIVAYAHYPAQFKTRAFERLRQCAKTQGMSIYERLMLIESELQRIQITLANMDSGLSNQPQIVQIHGSDYKFKWLAVYRQAHYVTLGGERGAFPELQPFTKSELPADAPFLRVLHGSEGSAPIIYMVQPIGSDGEHGSFILGVINEDFLWGNTNDSMLPDGMEFCIWDQKGLMRIAPDMAIDTQRFFSSDWAASGPNTMESQAIYAGRWVMFLKHRFQSPSWTVAVLESKAQVLAPITLFNRYFLLIMGGVLVLLLLSTSLMVRKNLVPIELLMDGVREISQNRFSHHVQVASGDEFEKLAQAFNHMSAQLEKQFNRLTLRSDLDRTILSLLDTEKIVMAVLDRMHVFFPCRTGAITILKERADASGISYIAPMENGDPVIEPCRIRKTDERQLLDHVTGWLAVESGSKHFEWLRPLQGQGVNQFIIFPVWVQQRIFALLSFGVYNRTVYHADDLQQARQLANQLAIAFSNANLISELKELNMGTLYALARTVDAKSSWTAGHSVRVMRTCLDIGRVMGLADEAMEDLRRASLLHDIGKIGIPIGILDKEDSLSPQEKEIIRTHSSIGVRILSPIKAYEQLLPIIHQHHERYDGKGYPLGLGGDEIHKTARILAVADTYDALVSDRPYRRGMQPEQAVELISRLGGSQLDPDVVEAFVRMVKDGKINRIPEKQDGTIQSAPKWTARSDEIGSRLQ